METEGGDYRWALNGTLKPSLVEWKLARSDRADMSSVALKPSLVEWKPSDGARLLLIGNPLKPSLVEWKQVRGVWDCPQDDVP